MVKIYVPPSKRPENRPQFLVSNICKRNVCLSDLALTIPAYQTVDLLDSKHYHFTIEQLEKSAKDGSLYKKSNIIKVRTVPYEPPISSGIHLVKNPQFIKQNLRSQVKIAEQTYEELEVTDEQYAEEAASIANADREPLIKPEE